MPRRNRNAWRNDRARAEAQQDSPVDISRRRRKRSKRGRRFEQRRRAAA